MVVRCKAYQLLYSILLIKGRRNGIRILGGNAAILPELKGTGTRITLEIWSVRNILTRAAVCLALSTTGSKDLCVQLFLRQEAKTSVSGPFNDREQRSVYLALSRTGNKGLCAWQWSLCLLLALLRQKQRSVCQLKCLALSRKEAKICVSTQVSSSFTTWSRDLCVYCLALSHQEAKICVSGLFYDRKQDLCVKLFTDYCVSTV